MKNSWKPIVVLPVIACFDGTYAVEQNQQIKRDGNRTRLSYYTNLRIGAIPPKEIQQIVSKKEPIPQDQIDSVQKNKPEAMESVKQEIG